MKISQNGIILLIQFEGVRLEPYNDSAGYATIGVGHLIGKRPVCAADIEKYRGFTRDMAEALLRLDLADTERAVTAAVKVPTSQNQFDAMVCFCFNVGAGNFQKSNVLSFTNKMEFKQAADFFRAWNKAGGVVCAGLTRRRENERALYLAV